MQASRDYPDFFIIGAPKCGTTSVAYWLDEHPNIFMCDPKEPYFFSNDIRSTRAAKTDRQYRNLFKRVENQHLVMGEASTTYLRSRIAVDSIERAIDSPRYIVCLRNPVDMAISVHAQLVKSGRENVSGFEEAWALQSERAKGRCVPVGAGEPKDLQYGEMCKLGKQLKELYDRVEPDRVLVIFLEDIKEDPSRQYLEVLRFLSVPDVGWRKFEVKNAMRVPRNTLVLRILSLLSRLKSKVGLNLETGVGRRLRNVATKPAKAEHKFINDSTRAMLSNFFYDDIDLISELTGRDLDHWKE